MAAKRLTERVATPFAGCKVNREGGYIDDVLICGTTSANGRDYPAAVFKRDHKAYEMRPVNCDHGRESTVDRRFGWFSNVRVGEDGRPRGTLNALKSHPMYERVMEAAERNPALFGFSHVAMCETKRDISGREVVEAIKSVESIDLVANPATTKGFFESKGSTVKISLRKFVERFGPKMGPAKWTAANKVCEELGDMADTPVMDDPPEDMTEGDLKTALMSALTPLLDEAFESGNSDKACSALRDFIKLHAKHTGKASDSSATPPDDDAAEESKKRKPDSWTVLKECQDADYNPGTSELQMLAGQPDAALRAAYVREQKAKAANQRVEKPQSAQRKPGADGGKKVEESKTVPTDAKAFADSIRD